MESPTYVTLSAQMALQERLAVTANNVANASTAGYKADRPLFQSLVEPLKGPGNEVAFVQNRATYIDRTAGAMETTDNPLDIAIQGDAFLAVKSGAGKEFTRDGKLQVSPEGLLVDAGGRPVLGGDGSTIQIPQGASDFKILGDGTLSVRADGATQEIGQIGMFRAGTATGMRKSGSGLIDGTAAAMKPVDPGDTSNRIVQGAIEVSTVQPVTELANMTELTRAYERLQQLIGQDDQREQSMIQILGKTN